MSEHVPFPEAGEGAYLHLSWPALEALFEQFGDDWRVRVTAGLDQHSPAVIAAALAAMLHNGSDEGCPWGLTIDEICLRIFDAMSLAIRGKSYRQVVEEAQKEAQELAEKITAKADESPAAEDQPAKTIIPPEA